MRLLSIVLKNLIVLLSIELTVRALAGLGMVALPPNAIFGFDIALQGWDAPTSKRLYQADPMLIYRMRPDADIVYPRDVLFPGKPGTYRVQTNSDGFRTAQVSEKKPPGVFRIACVGDSVTFGLNIDEPGTYPQLLARKLDEAYPQRFQVINFGTPGYSSRQELELIRQKVLGYEPDLVTFAVGANDRLWTRPLSDDQLIGLGQSFAGGLVIELRGLLDHFYTYRLLKRGVALLVQQGGDTGKVASPGDTRVSLRGIRDNIVAANALLQQAGASLLVVGADLFVTDAPRGMSMGVQQTGAVYVDIYSLFSAARRERTRQIESQHQLPPIKTRTGMTLFRVVAPGVTDVSLEWLPMGKQSVTTPMRDDGSNGDQVAGDGIWSAFVPGPPDLQIQYAYWQGTGSQRARDFQYIIDGPAWRSQKLAASGVGEIDTWGSMYLLSDGSHPNEEGAELIADHLFRAVVADEHVQAFLAKK